ncbi:hypothetical protein E2320_014249 [Naja naja]|nr:hypothetical protein E2320_014249 [Naja naja]
MRQTNPNMKILYLLFAFLFLAFLSEPGNAQRRCHSLRGRCHYRHCRGNTISIGIQDCQQGFLCCRLRFGK